MSCIIDRAEDDALNFRVWWAIGMKVSKKISYLGQKLKNDEKRNPKFTD